MGIAHGLQPPSTHKIKNTNLGTLILDWMYQRFENLTSFWVVVGLCVSSFILYRNFLHGLISASVLLDSVYFFRILKALISDFLSNCRLLHLKTS